MTFRSLVTAALIATFALTSAYADNPIQTENAKPGTTAWRITNPRFPASLQEGENIYINVPHDAPNASALYAQSEIQGYASLTSVNKGRPITFFVRTSVSIPYTMRIYRIGWYGGAGGRDVTPAALASTQFQGTAQTMPTADVNNGALVECQWNAAYTLQVPDDWTSGVYLVKLEANGKQSYIIFVVRDDQYSSTYVMQTSVNTYQAYNEWGGSSLYTLKNDKTAKTGHRVSFNRPYWRDWGAGDFLRYEINMVRWLEQEGYDVTYVTDVDVHAEPDLLLPHKAFFVVGHDEYWSWQMRANIERARDRGVSLGFFCANSAYWQVRFASSTTSQANRTIVAYKEDAITNTGGADPYTTDATTLNDRYITTWWSKIGVKAVGSTYADPVFRPEEMLLGVQYELLPECATCPSRGDVKVTDASSWLYDSAGVTNGTRLPEVLGYETDMMHHYQPVGTVSIARSLFPSENSPTRVDADMTVYTAPSGSTVFATGSIYWNTGLSDFGTHSGTSPTDFCYQKPKCDEVQWGLSKGVVPAVRQVTRNFLARAALDNHKEASSRLPASATASTADSEFPLANINDGSSTTAWRSTDFTPTVTLDLQSRQWIQRLRWKGASGVLRQEPQQETAFAPTDYVILISDNGTDWQQILSRTNPTWVIDGSEPINAQARYVRLQVSKVADGTGWRMGLWELWVEGAPPPPAGRLPVRSARGSGEVTGHTVGSASDFDNATYWGASNSVTVANNNAWYRLDLGTSRHIDRVRWTAAEGVSNGSVTYFGPTSYAIHVTDTDIVPCAATPAVSRIHSGSVVDGNEALSSLGRYVWLCTSKVKDGTGWPLGLKEFWVEGSDASTVLGANASIIECGDDALPPVIDTGQPVANATDGSTSTWFRATPGAYESNNRISIRLDFGAVKQIDRLRWYGLNGATDPSVYPAHSPARYSIEVSNDGSCGSWVTVVPEANYTGPVIAGDELLNARGRYLRLKVTKVNDGTGWALGLKEIWAEGY